MIADDLYQKPSGSSNGYLPDGAATAAYAFENQSNLHRERSFKGSNPMAPSHDVLDTGAYPMNSVPSRNMSSGELFQAVQLEKRPQVSDSKQSD